MKLDLLAQTLYLVATNEPAQAKQVIAGAIVEAGLTKTPIPDSFWFGIIRLDPDLLKDLLPNNWEPDSKIWAYALDKSPPLLSLLINRYKESFDFCSLSDHLLNKIDNRFFPIQISNTKPLTQDKILWLAQYQTATYETIAEQHQSLVFSNKFLLEITPAPILRDWLANSNITGLNGMGQAELANQLLDKVLPLLATPYHQQPEIKHLLITNLTAQRDYNFCYLLAREFARKHPADYMQWFSNQLLGNRTVENGKIQVWMPQKPDFLKTHCDIICGNPELLKLITPEMEIKLFASDLRTKLEATQHEWTTVKTLKPETQQEDIASIVTENLTQGSRSNLLPSIINKLKDYEPPILKFGYVTIPTFKRVLKRCTPTGKLRLLQSALEDDHASLTAYVLQNEDVSMLLPQWNPQSALWCMEIKRLHPANADPLLVRLQALCKPLPPNVSVFGASAAEMFSQVLAIHPGADLLTLIQAVTNGEHSFRTKHLKPEEKLILGKVAKLAGNEPVRKRTHVP